MLEEVGFVDDLVAVGVACFAYSVIEIYTLAEDSDGIVIIHLHYIRICFLSAIAKNSEGISMQCVVGIGAQGGSLEEVCKYGMNSTCGLIVNSSRAIIYADKTENFATVAGQEAQKVQAQMEKIMCQ